MRRAISQLTFIVKRQAKWNPVATPLRFLGRLTTWPTLGQKWEFLRLPIWLFLAAILSSSLIGFAEDRINLVHNFLPSPDGKHLAFLSERRYNGTRDFTLTLLTGKRDGYYTLVYSLTPRIREVILAPDGRTIAYVAQDYYHWMGIYIWDRGHVFGFDYSETRCILENIQFSKDQHYLRYRLRPIGFPRPFGDWVVISDRGQYLLTDEERKGIEWAPIVHPKEVPRFLTQPIPKVDLDTQMQWSPNSQSLYVLDEKGIWKGDIEQPFITPWTLVTSQPSIVRFQVSPAGTHLLFETASDTEEHDIWLLDLEKGETRAIGKGWSGTFAADGQKIYYGNLEAFYQVTLDGTPHRMRGSSYRP